ncbi:hypothetical protein B0H19DRAFT_1075775 [Mycena capillaripes]|nr:hypothetical protein B0H19DRAFT_1075775 [Mycena capillaripes]
MFTSPIDTCRRYSSQRLLPPPAKPLPLPEVNDTRNDFKFVSMSPVEIHAFVANTRSKADKRYGLRLQIFQYIMRFMPRSAYRPTDSHDIASAPLQWSRNTPPTRPPRIQTCPVSCEGRGHRGAAPNTALDHVYRLLNFITALALRVTLAKRVCDQLVQILTVPSALHGVIFRWRLVRKDAEIIELPHFESPLTSRLREVNSGAGVRFSKRSRRPLGLSE